MRVYVELILSEKFNKNSQKRFPGQCFLKGLAPPTEDFYFEPLTTPLVT